MRILVHEHAKYQALKNDSVEIINIEKRNLRLIVHKCLIVFRTSNIFFQKILFIETT